MPLFEVTLSDGTATIMQAHNKTQLREALQNATLTKVTQMKRCKACRKVAATVQNTLCETCWQNVLETCREAWKDVAMSEQDLEDMALSYFVDC